MWESGKTTAPKAAWTICVFISAVVFGCDVRVEQREETLDKIL